MTTVYIFQYPLWRSTPSNFSAMRKCAVELTGRNSVSPSMMPRMTERRYGFCKRSSKSQISNFRSQNQQSNDQLAKQVRINTGHQVVHQDAPAGRKLFKLPAGRGL